MDDIDFIKWMCENAGIRFICLSRDMIQYAVKIGKRSVIIGSQNWKDLAMPFVIQRAIESLDGCRIEKIQAVNGDYWHTVIDGKTSFKGYLNADDAKIEVIKYRYNKRQNNDVIKYECLCGITKCIDVNKHVGRHVLCVCGSIMERIR